MFVFRLFRSKRQKEEFVPDDLLGKISFADNDLKRRSLKERFRNLTCFGKYKSLPHTLITSLIMNREVSLIRFVLSKDPSAVVVKANLRLCVEPEDDSPDLASDHRVVVHERLEDAGLFPSFNFRSACGTCDVCGVMFSYSVSGMRGSRAARCNYKPCDLISCEKCLFFAGEDGEREYTCLDFAKRCGDPLLENLIRFYSEREEVMKEVSWSKMNADEVDILIAAKLDTRFLLKSLKVKDMKRLGINLKLKSKK